MANRGGDPRMDLKNRKVAEICVLEVDTYEIPLGKTKPREITVSDPSSRKICIAEPQAREMQFSGPPILENHGGSKKSLRKHKFVNRNGSFGQSWGKPQEGP